MGASESFFLGDVVNRMKMMTATTGEKNCMKLSLIDATVITLESEMSLAARA